MYLGVATVGIGVERVIGLDRGVVLRQGEEWLLATAATVVMISLATIAATSEKACSSRSAVNFLLPNCVVAAEGLVAATRCASVVSTLLLRRTGLLCGSSGCAVMAVSAAEQIDPTT